MVKHSNFLILSVLICLFSGILTSSAQIVTVFITRHAEKVISDDKDPDLSEKGKIRAQALAEQFSQIRFNRLFSTPYVRTKETLKPLSEIQQVEITEYNPLLHQSLVEKIQKLETDENLFISGHSNSIPDLLNRFTDTRNYTEIDENTYGDVWILTLIRGSCVSVIQLKL